MAQDYGHERQSWGAGGAPLAPCGGPRTLNAQALFSGARKLLIEHEGETYVLQLTRQNKLLLTK